MGEVQGAMWTTMLFTMIFFGIVGLIFLVLDTMDYHSTIYAVEDNIKASNYAYFEQLDKDYSPCQELGQTEEILSNGYALANDTNKECSGIVSIEDNIVTYQLSYDGMALNRKASGTDDSIVLLPY